MTTVGMTVSKLMAWMTDMLRLRAWMSVESQYIVIQSSHAAQRGSVLLFYAMKPWLKANAVGAALLNNFDIEERGEPDPQFAQMASVTIFLGEGLGEQSSMRLQWGRYV